jgi:Domain of unknown function (DUF5056)
MIDQHDPIEDLLKADAAEYRAQHIDNAGFSERVMVALPARRRVSREMRVLLPFGLAMSGLVIAFFFAGGRNFAIDVGMDIVTTTFTPTVFAFFALAFTLVAASLTTIKD